MSPFHGNAKTYADWVLGFIIDWRVVGVFDLPSRRVTDFIQTANRNKKLNLNTPGGAVGPVASKPPEGEALGSGAENLDWVLDTPLDVDGGQVAEEEDAVVELWREEPLP